MCIVPVLPGGRLSSGMYYTPKNDIFGVKVAADDDFCQGCTSTVQYCRAQLVLIQCAMSALHPTLTTTEHAGWINSSILDCTFVISRMYSTV